MLPNKPLQTAAEYFGLGYNNLHLLNQGVSSHVEYVEQASQDKVTADGAVTDRPEVVLCIRTADCAPVLLADYEHGVIGAAHAGWRGALNGIVENTVKIMIEHGAHVENIHAAVGPCLQQQSFECKEDMRREFLHKDEENNRWFKDKADGEHFLFNLEGFVVHKLEQLGIGNISASGIDTFTAIGDFFSYRRNCKLGLVQSPKDFPSHLSTIKL